MSKSEKKKTSVIWDNSIRGKGYSQFEYKPNEPMFYIAWIMRFDFSRRMILFLDESFNDYCLNIFDLQWIDYCLPIAHKHTRSVIEVPALTTMNAVNAKIDILNIYPIYRFSSYIPNGTLHVAKYLRLQRKREKHQQNVIEYHKITYNFIALTLPFYDFRYIYVIFLPTFSLRSC